MLLSLNDSREGQMIGADGSLGYIDDFYFDDDKWAVRYIVVETGALMGRRVLISPIAVTHLDRERVTVTVALTEEQVRNSPAADARRPVSRQYERTYGRYYGYPPYWIGPGYWGGASYPRALAREAGEAPAAEPAIDHDDSGDEHLRSAREVSGYHIQATDGEIGHVDDFIVDAETWAIRFLRVDTSNFIGGKPVLVPQRALRDVSWLERKISVGLTTEAIRNSPEYDPVLLEEGEERAITRYYEHAR